MISPATLSSSSAPPSLRPTLPPRLCPSRVPHCRPSRPVHMGSFPPVRTHRPTLVVRDDESRNHEHRNGENCNDGNERQELGSRGNRFDVSGSDGNGNHEHRNHENRSVQRGQENGSGVNRKSPSKIDDVGLVLVSFYKFADLPDVAALVAPLRSLCASLDVSGGIILSPEGVNGSLCGPRDAVDAVLEGIQSSSPCLQHLRRTESPVEGRESALAPGLGAPFRWRHVRIKLKREVVPLGIPGVRPAERVGTYVRRPEDWNALIRAPGTLVVDVRNDYEVRIGRFKGAVDPKTVNFKEFPAWADQRFGLSEAGSGEDGELGRGLGSPGAPDTKAVALKGFSGLADERSSLSAGRSGEGSELGHGLGVNGAVDPETVALDKKTGAFGEFSDRDEARFGPSSRGSGDRLESWPGRGCNGSADTETVAVEQSTAQRLGFSSDSPGSGAEPQGWRPPPARIAMYCTGGIRCEKTTSFLLSRGMTDVYHLEGGILGYLDRVDPAESLFEGECFVFDKRVAIGHGHSPGTHGLCHACKKPVAEEDKASPLWEDGVSCPYCFAFKSAEEKARARARQVQFETTGEIGGVRNGNMVREKEHVQGRYGLLDRKFKVKGPGCTLV